MDRRAGLNLTETLVILAVVALGMGVVAPRLLSVHGNNRGGHIMSNVNIWVWLLCASLVCSGISMSPILLFKPMLLSAIDMLVATVPFALWSSMFFAELIPKSLGNLAEAPMVGLSSGLLVSLRPIMGFGVERRHLGGLASLALACIAAIAIYYLTPALPE